jgi:hypothetical protein
MFCYYAVRTPRAAGLYETEHLLEEVLVNWCPITEEEQDIAGATAAEIAARNLFHLWQGPLLGGPSMVSIIL